MQDVQIFLIRMTLLVRNICIHLTRETYQQKSHFIWKVFMLCKQPTLNQRNLFESFTRTSDSFYLLGDDLVSRTKPVLADQLELVMQLHH